MKLFKYLLCIFPLIFMVNLFAQTPNPRPPRTTWNKELKYIQDGTMTFTYKTFTTPAIASPTFSGTATGPLDGSAAFTAAGGDRALQWYATHSDTLTGTLVTYYGRSTGGDSSGAGTIRGFEIGGRLIDAAGMKASVVTGGYSWADAKQGIVTTLRGFEASLDGAAGSTVTTASGVVIFNNSSGTQTNSYAVDINEGNPSGRKAFTADMRMQNGATFDNAANNVLEWNENSDELKWTFGSNTISVSSTDVTLFDYGTIDLGTDALDVSDGNITNVGTVALDGINPDGTVIGNTGIWAWTSDGDSLVLNLYKSTEMLELKTGATTVFKVDSTGLLTVANGINLGTSKSIVGTTALTVGGGTETVAVNSSDWDIDATGTMSGIGNITSNGTYSTADDQLFTLGTTITNAATKLTMEFDETTTGIGQFNIGDLSNPQVLNTNPGATVVASTININHSAGAGNCDDLLGSYSKVNVIGDGDAGITIVGDASRAYVGLTGGANNSVASQAYGTQAWARHQGTGAITAMSGLSAKLDVGAENFTASTANAGHFHIDGAGDVTGQYDGVMIEAYPDVDTMDALLALASDSGADVAYGIRFAGTFANALMQLPNGAFLFAGTAANGDAVYAEVGSKDATGSVYISTAGLYVQVANAGAAADWYKVTSTDAD